MKQPLTYQVRLTTSFEQALDAVTTALKQEGFGVLTRIDVQNTVKEKLGEEFRPYVIFGACNPHLAHRALTADPSVGVMLPCNVTVEEIGADILITIVNPKAMLTFGSLADNPTIREVAQMANERMQQVVSHLEKQTAN